MSRRTALRSMVASGGVEPQLLLTAFILRRAETWMGTEIQPSGAKPAPRCKAILLCDQVIVEENTKKTSLIGTFDSFRIGNYPGKTRPFIVFLQLLEGIGEYEIAVEIQVLNDGGTTLARAAGLHIKWPERMRRLNLGIPVPPLPIEKPGKFDLIVFANKQEIDRQTFEAIDPKGA